MSGLRSESMQKTVKKTDHSSMCSLPSNLGHTGPHGQMWPCPETFISGHGDRQVPQ